MSTTEAREQTRADKDADSAARRIAQLEDTLARVNIELDDLRATLDSVTASGPYKVGRLLAKLYDRYLPLYTRRRLAASTVGVLASSARV